MPPETEVLLMFAARYSHVRDTILPGLNSKRIVLCDRYIDSSYAYQGAGAGVPMRFIDQLADDINRLVVPDRVLLFSVSDDVAESRISQRCTNNRFDAASIDYRQRVRICYRDRFARADERYSAVQADASLENVHDQVRLALAPLLDGLT